MEAPRPPVFTGERLPGDDPQFRADLARHLAAYHLARPYCFGKTVLDAGCGEGYGTALLAGVAARAVGVDRDRPALVHARARYGRDGLLFVCADLERLGALGCRFDVVCNFQVIEHLEAPERLLRELSERLVPGGELILTTPNRLTSFSPNPYHVREYTAGELAALLGPYFARVDVRGVAGNARVAAYEAARRRQVERLLRLDPLGLRTRLPAPLVRWAFARLARLVRTRMARARVPVAEIEPEDFLEQPTADGALDLLAICTR
jgi:2-polyprenyl-3-methyl-5-hydroxy-6-metoxy-1,4-benzoquinol methylase